jgi:hypothetical protein
MFDKSNPWVGQLKANYYEYIMQANEENLLE